MPRDRNETAILTRVDEDPGVTQLELQHHFGLAWGTVAYHVSHLLERHSLKSYRQEPSLHLFSPDVPDEVLPAVAALRKPLAPDLLTLLEEPRQLFELSSECGVGKNVVKAHLRRLENSGLIEAEGTHRPKYRANSGLLAKVNAFLRGKNGE